MHLLARELGRAEAPRRAVSRAGAGRQSPAEAPRPLAMGTAPPSAVGRRVPSAAHARAKATSASHATSVEQLAHADEADGR